MKRISRAATAMFWLALATTTRAAFAQQPLPFLQTHDVVDAACAKAPADHWNWDGVHPIDAGHGLMAREWLKTVNRFWGNK